MWKRQVLWVSFYQEKGKEKKVLWGGWFHAKSSDSMLEKLGDKKQGKAQ